ncbi:hypothetical protein [Sphingobacterium siyangense]|uniref:hypothetical protein n=1 Tax=Sphingobacterium siyangense TaxID=459529 RepID=UPI003DA2328A
MAAEAKSAKTNVNLSTADLALDHYVVVNTEGESAGESSYSLMISTKKCKLPMRSLRAVAEWLNP